jgi:hypothetical protein
MPDFETARQIAYLMNRGAGHVMLPSFSRPETALGLSRKTGG